MYELLLIELIKPLETKKNKHIFEKDISALRPAERTPINEEPKKIFKKANTDDIKVVEFITALENKYGKVLYISAHILLTYIYLKCSALFRKYCSG